MKENEANGTGTDASNIESILKARERLDQVLKEKYRREVTILFTDICGYTQYLDKRGDISGRTLLLKHNQIVLPAVERHKGKVIEIIGDAVMASFVVRSRRSVTRMLSLPPVHTPANRGGTFE